MVEPEVGSERMTCSGGDDAILESVGGRKAEDAHGFHADVVVGGIVDKRRIRIVRDGTGKNVGGAAAGMGDADEWDFDLLEGAVVVEVEASELADAYLRIDSDDAVNFFAGVTVTLEADFGFEEFKVGWEWRL